LAHQTLNIKAEHGILSYHVSFYHK